MTKRFLVKLKDVAEKDGRTAYAVAKQSGLNYNTVNKFISSYIELDRLPAHVLTLVEFYKRDWRDPAVIEVIEIEDDSSGQLKTLLAPA